MSENLDLVSNNLCIPEDAFDHFQAISMYQEEQYITLTEVGPTKPKDPDPGELSHLSYDNEVVVTTENEVNSTVNESIEEMESSEQQTLDDSSIKTNVNVDEIQNSLDHDYEPQNIRRKGKKKKHVINDTIVVSNNSAVLGTIPNSSVDIQVDIEQESPIISSSVVSRKRGRKPKPKPVLPENSSEVPDNNQNQEISNISITPFSSDPENTDTISAAVKRKRGRPRKVSLPNEHSSELSGSDNNRLDNLSSSSLLTPVKGKRGRPRKVSLETNIDSHLKHHIETFSNDLISMEDLNVVDLNKTPNGNKSRKDSIELQLMKMEQIDTDNKPKSESDSKIISDISVSENDDLDDISLSKLKSLPDSSNTADDYSSENNKDHNSTNISSEHTNLDPPPNPSINKAKPKKIRRGRPKKGCVATYEQSDPIIETAHDVVTTSTDVTQIDNTLIDNKLIDNTLIDNDETENMSLSKLKEIKSEAQSTENNNTPEVATTEAQVVKVENSTNEVNGTPSKRNTKMPVMSDFEYNIDSVLGNEATVNEDNVDNSLLVEDTSKRPIRRKVPTLRYDEESDEDPFANVELSDDDEPRGRKGNRYYSDDEYIPGRRGNKDIDSTDSEAHELLDEAKELRKKKIRKRSDNQSPRKKGKKDESKQDLESDIEIIPPSEIKANDDSQSQPMQSWGSSNEFENFLAKKIQGTSLKIKKVSSTEPNENKAIEIPVIDPKQAKKTIEMCSQTNIINTVSTAMQTSTPYDIPMKENITLTPEQSTKACDFLHSIVKTTSELGTLMTQKSEDFIKKKINTTHVTDTMKMDYCVKKSFLLFKLAKHNLMQMEEDLAKQYDEFLKTNDLEGCREVPKAVIPSAKPASSDSDCEIVEEPVKATSSKKLQNKPKFNPKTVFLNKELSIKIAKKPAENKKLLKDIKGRHTVWINDTVMVKKVKPTQSFLAQDSRNKKPPDNNITTKMVSDFFKNYYRKEALSVCAPFVTTDWLNVSRECVCNYFVVKPLQFNNGVTHSENVGISMNSTASNASASETNHELKAIKHIANTIVTCPEPLFKLCFRIVKSQMHDLNHVNEVCQHIQNELTDGKNEPVTLFRLSLRALTARAVDITERRPTSPKIIPSDDTSKINVLPLKLLCHRRIVAILSNSSQKDSGEKQKDVAELRCSTEELNDYFPIHSSKYISPSSNIRNGMKSLLSLCVEFVQRKQVLDTHNITILIPKSLKSIAFENIKQFLYGDLREYLLETSQLNLNQHNHGIMIEGLTINSVNTLTEEAFLNLEQSHTDIPDSSEYLDDFDNEDHFESDFNEPEEDNQTETNWVSQVQMKELRSCLNASNSDVNQGENVSIITQIKLEPLDDVSENIVAPAHVKTELVSGLDEMTVIPDIKPEVAEQLSAIPIQRQDSDSYDVDAFEQFVSSNKIMHEQNSEDIFSQSVLRVRRQHEPDYDEENDTSMSLLIPQTYEPLTIETVKGNLMESSSDEESSRTKKVAGKKKPDKRNKGKQKKPDLKTNNKDTATLAKEKVTNNEVATLTRRMRDRIRQEEKKDDSSDSEVENLPLRLRSKKEQEKSKQVQNNKDKESEIQCNNVDSTDQVDEDVANFTGFPPVDQSDISKYQEYMKCVLNKIIPDKEEVNLKKVNSASKENRNKEPELPILNPDEPVELLECEPTMPIFDDTSIEKRPPRPYKGKLNMLVKEGISKKDEVPNKEDIQKKKVTLNKEDISKEESSKDNASFVDRHGWHCYPVNTEDSKLYQSACIALEKLPESFVQTYFEYQGIVKTSKDENDEEIDRLTNLNSLNRTAQLNIRAKIKSRREADGDRSMVEKISEPGSRPDSPTYSDHCDELEPSDDEGTKLEDEVAPSIEQKSTENTLAKNLLMNDNDSDSDGPSAKVKQESMDDAIEAKRSKPSSKPKKKEDVVIEDGEDLMLTADKMMNKELTLLHAPIVLTDDVKHTPTKGPVTRNKQKSASKNQSTSTKTQNEEDSSSEEEKQWVTTKEKLLKRLGRKEGASIDDAKRAKLVSEFIERRGYLPDSHIRSKARTKTRGSGKKFLERQKQLRVLSRELFGESSDAMMSKRSQKAQASLLYKGRRNIRKVIDKKSLARSTVVANMEEFERKRKLNARQTKLRELLGCEDGVNVLVINDEVCLEYDFKQNRPVVTIHPFFTKVMKAHQYEGVKFMWDACFESLAEIESGHLGGGCILAHCMGLGKTLQVLALLHTVLTHPGVRMQRVLVCCPLSTVLNWVDEIHKWIGPVTNEIKVFELSKLKKTYERAYQLEDWYNGGGIFIIGYELFRSLTTLDPFLDDVRPTIVNKIRSALLDPGPDIIVCDEGHLLKNDCSVLAVAMSRVVTRRRIVLTGTPMQNNLREYYCMVNFVKPNLLGTYSEYSNRFENPIMNGQHRDSREEDIKLMKARTHILHKVLEGCLQRQEASVLYPYLPKKYEYTVFITLTQCQWDLYKHYLYHYGKTSKQSILKDFHILQKIWSHPQVLHNFQTKARDREEKNRIKAEKLEDDLATEDLEEIKPNASEDLWWLDYLDGGNMLETLDSSNKFVAVFRILDECIALGDKVLIFSTSLFCLDALEYFLKKINKWSLGQEYFRLDGSVPAEVRQKWCREFNADNNYKTKLFLVSTRAGCLGLNMTAANRVIIMDTSWNPAHDIQSIFRVYRFGQKKDCFIYRLVAMGTMEQKIYERSVTKQAVACRVVDEQQIDRHYNMADLTELYKFDEAGSTVVGGVAVGVHDVALLRVARHAALHAVHEHDSLLRGSSEQGLPEHERNAAWMQFQQEQAHKQMENKLIVSIPHIPKISLKRLHGHEYAASTAPLTPDIKTEDNSEDYKPNEPKTKKGKKSPFIKCSIPIQDTGEPSEKLATQPELKYYTRGRPRKDASLAKPGTSKETHIVPHEDLPVEPHQEEIMVEKITDILIKHNFQSRKGSTEISNLVMRVRNMVKKGYINDDDQSDDLTASIAKILLPKQMPLPMVTDIMCESINNSVAPFVHRKEDPEVITSDPTPRNFTVFAKRNDEPEFRTKRKAAIAAEKSIAHDVVINLDDDDFDSRDADFVPERGSQSVVNNKGKKKAEFENSSPPRFLDDDESTLSADSSPQKIEIDTNYRTPERTSNIDKDNNISSLKQAYNTKKPKDRTIKTNPSKERNDNQTKKTIESKPTTSKAADKEDWNGILLSDDDEAISSLQSTEILSEEAFSSKPVKTPEKSLENTPEKYTESDEIVPLPFSLLKNQNFINIVAHTYLVGNPMLDEDAATLAAQYSTLKALKEAEQTGKDVCSGPIYDIAVKVIGKEILKKMHSVNPKAASKSADAAAANIQRKEQMIASEKSSSGPDTSAKTKLRDDLINEKLGLQKIVEHVPTSVAATPIVASMKSKVVPVGLIKTAAGMANESFGQPGVESILPDDDEIIMSDDLPELPVPPPPVQQPATPQSNKPVTLNHMLLTPKKHPLVVHPVRVTVGNSCALPSSLPEAPKVIMQPFRTRKVQPAPSTAMISGASTPPNVQVAPAPGVAERILPNDDTICLDSDDEESITPHVQLSLQPARPAPAPAPAAPVPVSLTMAHAPGVKLPLPAMPPMPNLMPFHQLHTTQKQMLVLRQVATKDGVQPKYVLIPSNQLPLPKGPIAEQPQPSSSQPQVTSTFQAIPGESVLSTRKLEIAQTISKTRCKPNDIIKITSTGQIEVISRSDKNKVATPAPPPPAAAVPAPQSRQIAPKPSSTASVDLTNVPTEVAKPKPAPAKHSTSASVDLTNTNIEVAKPRLVSGNHSASASVDLTNTPTAKSRLIGSKPSTSASVDLTNVSIELEKQKPVAAPKSTAAPKPAAVPKPTAAPKPVAVPKPAAAQIETNKSQTKVAARRARRISSSSSSSSCTSNPENPLSILRDVVHIRAADYPTTSAAPKPSNSKSIILRTEKCTNSNISVQHVVSADSKNTVSNSMKSFTSGSLKLTKVPKNKVPKYVDTAAEKQIKKDAIMRRITPFLNKNQVKPKEEPKPRGKNTINFDNFSSSTSTLLKTNAVAVKPANKKSEISKFSKASGSKASITVDLTNNIPSGTTVSKTKVDVKKRISSVVETTPAKKKKTEPMTLKDFNLDDIDDIIELE